MYSCGYTQPITLMALHPRPPLLFILFYPNPELDHHRRFNPPHFCHQIQEVDDNGFTIIVTHFKCPHYKWSLSLWTEKHKDFRGHVSCVYFGLRFDLRNKNLTKSCQSSNHLQNLIFYIASVFSPLWLPSLLQR